MSLSATALVTLIQAKAHLRIDAVASLHVDAEFLGVGDGSDVTFDLDNTPIDGSLTLKVNDVLQVEGTDFTISAATVTFTTAPTLDHGITASYDYAASSDTFESYDDLLLEDLIEAATKRAEDFTGRAFIQRTVTEEHYGDGSAIMRLYRRPLVSITSVVRRISEAVATGDGSTTAFTLDEVPTNDASVSLYVDGSLQTITTDYTLDGATVTFVTAPADDTKITAKYTHTILAINEYTELLHQGRLKCVDLWTANKIYQVVYEAGYAATRAATQLLVPDAVSAILLILAFLFENRTDQVDNINISGIGSASFKLPSQAEQLLNPLKVNF